MPTTKYQLSDTDAVQKVSFSKFTFKTCFRPKIRAGRFHPKKFGYFFGYSLFSVILKGLTQKR